VTLLVYAGIGGAVLAGLYAADRLATRVVSPPRRLPERAVPELGLAHDDLAIPARSGQLAAWLIPGARDHATSGGGDTDSAPLVVLVHGWGAHYGTVLLLAEQLQAHGVDTLLFDIQGHGRNDPRPYVTIRHFRDDVMDVVSWARERAPGRPIVLAGHSMGGAASVLAVAEGSDVDGLVLIAAPSDVLTITSEYLTDHGLPGPLMTSVLRPFWWPRIGGSFARLTPYRRIGELELPILMLHPELDQRVRSRHADRLASAGGVRYHLIEGREHTDVLAAPETAELLLNFLGATRRSTVSRDSA
jgi:pimeloyl-ACP methyl ester carboxylesterase